MSTGKKSRATARAARHARIRRKISGTMARPRMAIMVSNKHMYVQFIDDARGVTVASASTQGMEGGHNVATAGRLGQKAAQCAMAAGVKSVVIDRGGFKFHGRVKAMVDAAHAAGLATGIKEEK